MDAVRDIVEGSDVDGGEEEENTRENCNESGVEETGGDDGKGWC